MSLYKFKKRDRLYSRIKAHPRISLFVYNGAVYYNNTPHLSGALNSGQATHVSGGHISLYEINVDRPSGDLVYPFVSKNNSLVAFKTVSTSDFSDNTQYGDILTGSYPMSASVSRELFATDDRNRSEILALRNTLNYYTNLSPHHAFSASQFPATFGSETWNKDQQALNFIDIPSIYYGSSIKKGSLDLKFYVTGTLVGRLQDVNRNGELIQVEPSGSNGSGSVAGVVLYNEGFLLLTGSWDLSDGLNTDNYPSSSAGSTTAAPSWIYFATGLNDGAPWGFDDTNEPDGHVSSSYSLEMSGTNYIPVMTLFAHAPEGALNHSNNPTYITANQEITASATGSGLMQNDQIEIKNIVKSVYNNASGSFEKITYISKIGLYDENKNLIGIAKLARPVKKKLNQGYTFKLKMDF